MIHKKVPRSFVPSPSLQLSSSPHLSSIDHSKRANRLVAGPDGGAGEGVGLGVVPENVN
jgi:hypothetical protein